MKEVILTVAEASSGLDNMLSRLQEVLPDRSDFLVYETLLPVLTKVRQQSELLSGEMKPTCCFVISGICNIRNSIKRAVRIANEKKTEAEEESNELHVAIYDNCVKAFTALEDDIKDRFPNNGCLNEYWALAHLVHPYYKGVGLRQYGKQEEFIDKLVKDHEASRAPTPEEAAALKAKEKKNKSALKRRGSDEDEDALTALLREEAATKKDTGKEDPQTLVARPVEMLRAELNRYMSMPHEELDCDVLAFWRENKNLLPELAKLARYF